MSTTDSGAEASSEDHDSGRNPSTGDTSTSNDEAFFDQATEFAAHLVARQIILQGVTEALQSHPNIGASLLNRGVRHALKLLYIVILAYSELIVSFECGVSLLNQEAVIEKNLAALEWRKSELLLFGWNRLRETYQNTRELVDMAQNPENLTQDDQITWEECGRAMDDIKEIMSGWEEMIKNWNDESDNS